MILHPLLQNKIKTLLLLQQGFGGTNWNRTNDPHDVNVVL